MFVHTALVYADVFSIFYHSENGLPPDGRHIGILFPVSILTYASHRHVILHLNFVVIRRSTESIVISISSRWPTAAILDLIWIILH